MKKLLILSILFVSIFGIEKNLYSMVMILPGFGPAPIPTAEEYKEEILNASPAEKAAKIIAALEFGVKKRNTNLCAFALTQGTIAPEKLSSLIKKASTVEIAQLLINEGASINPLILHTRMDTSFQNIFNGGTLIDPELITLFIQKGLSVLSTDAQGDTPLHIIACNLQEPQQKERLRSLIISSHLKPREIIALYAIRNKLGETALDIANNPSKQRQSALVRCPGEPTREQDFAMNFKALHDFYNDALKVPQIVLASHKDLQQESFLRLLPLDLISALIDVMDPDLNRTIGHAQMTLEEKKARFEKEESEVASKKRKI